MVLDRQETTLLRGIAIICIVIHNILVGSFGFVSCNEMTYSIDRTYLFMEKLEHFDFSIIGQLFAFIGWTAVPVFVFLSGYGMARKYQNKIIETKKFFRYYYLKLFFLMLPAVLFYILVFSLQRDWNSVISNVLSLTLLGNIWHFLIHLNPTVYWYFGLTWELYICFFLMRGINKKSESNITLLVCGLCSFLFQILVFYIAPNNHVLLEWLRRNFVGWIAVFVVGIFYAKSGRSIKIPENPIILIVLSLMAIPTICLMNYHFLIWLFLPFVALYFFFVLARLMSFSRILKAVFTWIGSYSATIFVTQTIARGFARRLLENYSIPWMVITYLVLTIGFAVIYKLVYERLKRVII